MCKDNTIITSWSWIGMIICLPIMVGGIIVAKLGTPLTWGEIMFIPAIISFFLNKRHQYCFADSGFTVQWMVRKRIIPVEQIKQVDVFTTKSGTWIVIELHGAPPIPPEVSRVKMLFYSVRNRKNSFLLPLQWGERDKALQILQDYCPQKIIIHS